MITDAALAGCGIGLNELMALHRRVADVISASGRANSGGINAKGDKVRTFDLAADRAVLRVLADFGCPLLVESEESGARQLGAGPPAQRLIVDPVDGSDNWARGLPLSAVCCALLPVSAPVVPEHVQAALIGPLPYAPPFLAEAGRGAWCDGQRRRTSGVSELADALVLVELNHLTESPGLGRIMAEARGVRCYGCASRALTMVATGQADAYVDIRRRLTAESYLAGCALVLEAGGAVVGLDGDTLPTVSSLTERVGLIAAATTALATEIVRQLDMRHG